MMHINGYRKRKEEKDKMWQELFSEMHKSWDHMVRRYPDMEPKAQKLIGKPDEEPQVNLLPLQKLDSGTQPKTLPNTGGDYKQLLTNPDYPKRAAAGWAQYKSDADKRQTLLRDPNYQKWQKALGVTDREDEDAYPQSNWSFSQNNQFGYLYGQNPEDAKQFAKLVNAEYSNTPTMISEAAAMEEATVAEDMGLVEKIKESGGVLGYIGDAFQKSAELEAENSKNALEKGVKDAQNIQEFLDSVGELETANADMNKETADNVTDGIKSVIEDGANNGGALAEAQANAEKTTTDTVVEGVAEIMHSFEPQPVEPQKNNEPIDIPLPEIGLIGAEPEKNPVLLTPMEAMLGNPGDYEEKAALGYRRWKGDHNNRLNIENSDGYKGYLDFIAKNNFAGTPEGMAAAQKLLGPGYTIEEPQPNWSSMENNRYGYLYYTDPRAAAEYARDVNARYAAEEEQNTREWAKDHQGLAQVSTWITDRLGFAETLDSELNYAQYGQVPYTWQVTPSSHSEIVKDTIHDDVLGGDPVSRWVYDALDSSGDAAYQAYLQKLMNVGGPIIGAVESGSDAYNQALREAMAMGMTDEEAIKYAREMAFSSGVGNIASIVVGEFLPQGDDVKSSLTKEGISNMVEGVVGEGVYVADRYDELMKTNLQSGMTEEEADYAAKLQVLKELGMSALYDLSMGMAYGLGRSDNELSRSLTRK